MKRTPVALLLMMTFLIALLTACGGPGEEGAAEGVNQVGDSATTGDVTITLNSASVVSNKVKANFTVKNNGSGDLAIDLATFFTIATESEGEVVQVEIDPTCRNNILQGSVPAGGELTGDICWRSDPTLTWPAQATISYGGVSWLVKPEE